ncbi:MAG: hypothetical protein J6I72_06475 [Muribaculaceae bacterium]|nr:hypothetical protein [Muribaculaceae bacterium]
MTIPGLFKEYIWLIETINRYGKITFAELNELWKRLVPFFSLLLFYLLSGATEVARCGEPP